MSLVQTFDPSFSGWKRLRDRFVRVCRHHEAAHNCLS